MSHHKDFALDDDDLVADGTLSEEELKEAVEKFRRLRSAHSEVWEEESEQC
jgi:hypothetical protein